MIVINKDQLIDKIEGHGFKIAVIYDSLLRGTDPGYKPYFEKYEEENPEALLQKIEKFSRTYPGTFSILLKKAGGGQNSCVITAQFDGPAGAQNQQSTGPNLVLNGANQFESQEAMETRLLNKIKSEMKLQALEARNRALEAKLQGMESTGGKLATMLEGWIQAKFFGQKVPSMQGTDSAENTETKTEVNPEELKQAMGKILDLLGHDTIIKLSQKLQPGDPVILMVKNYANS